MDTIITVDGMTIDYSKVRGIELENRHNSRPTQIRVIFNTRKEYVYNPEQEIYELHEITDEVRYPYSDYDQAKSVIEEMEEVWNQVRKQL